MLGYDDVLAVSGDRHWQNKAWFMANIREMPNMKEWAILFMVIVSAKHYQDCSSVSSTVDPFLRCKI